MHALLAASAIAAALIVVPIEARVEPLTSAVETESANASSPGPAQSAQTSQNSGLEAQPQPGSASADSENDPNAVAAPVPAVARATSADTICATLDRSAGQNGLPLDFFTRLIWQESRFNPFSVSHAGAQGIAQFMPGTARLVGLINPFDPIQALPKSAALLRELRAQFGNLGLAAAAYNAGPKRIEDWLANRKPLPQETKAYVRIITGRSAQEWTSPEAGTFDAAPAAPAPCAQLAKPVPHRSQPVIAVHQPERPARVIVVAQKSDRTAHQADRIAHQPDRTAQRSDRTAHQPDRTAQQSDRTAHQPDRATHQPDRALANIPANGSGKGVTHGKTRVAAHAETKATTHAEAKVASRETIRCCRLAAKDEKGVHSDSNVASWESVRCCRAPANGVKLAHLEPERTTSKSVIPPVKSTIPAPKSIIAAPKSEARTHPRGSASAHGAPAEASHPLKREQAAPAHRRPAPNSRAARLA
jgi:Transglycosylase SLT domain